MASDLKHFTSWMVTLKCHISSWIPEQKDLGKLILTKHGLFFKYWTDKNHILPVPVILKCRKDKKGCVRKSSEMKGRRRLNVWFGSLWLDVSVRIAKHIWFCSLAIFVSSFFKRYIPPCFSSLLWQRCVQVLNILRPCSAMDQQEWAFFS